MASHFNILSKIDHEFSHLLMCINNQQFFGLGVMLNII